MLRCTLARRIALRDVVSSPLRLCGGPLLHCNVSNTVRCKRSASSTTEPAHDSLSSFLAYAERSGLDRTSTTFTGTYYEYATQSVLRRYGFDLIRVGGRGDRGVDLRGTWRIATSVDADEERQEVELPVIVQCKRLKSKAGPNLVRELEGALAGRTNTLGVLVGTKGATKGVRDAMGRSKMGICWVMLEMEQGGSPESRETLEEEQDDSADSRDTKEQDQGFDGIFQSMKDEIASKAPKAVQEVLQPSSNESSVSEIPARLGRVRQMLWNRAANTMGLEGLNVVLKYDGAKDETGEIGREVVLMWQDRTVHGLASKPA